MVEKTGWIFEDMFGEDWEKLSLTQRVGLLHGLGIEDKLYDGNTMDKILTLGQDDLPGEVRGRLLMAHDVKNHGFSLEQFEQRKKALLSHQERL